MTDRGEGDAPPRTLDPEVIFAAVDGWLAMTGQPSPEAEPGSALAGDTAKSSKHQVSHAAWNGITHAVDQLHALKTLIVDARVVHTYVPFSLLRSAIENAATAVWLLSPRKRDERVQRCLKLARHEAWEHGQVAKADRRRGRAGQAHGRGADR
jgi:hypothetical protein